jgi:hypothetical protein
VGLPAPGTSRRPRLAPLLAKPQVDARAPEVRQEQAQVRDAVKQSRRQQRRKQQEEAPRGQGAARAVMPSTAWHVAFDADPRAAPPRSPPALRPPTQPGESALYRAATLQNEEQPNA